MFRKGQFFLMVLPFTILNCTSEVDAENISDISTNDTTVAAIETIDTAQLMINNCYSCHNPNVMGKDKVAPNLSHIKDVYLAKNASEKEFITFISNPSLDNALMTEAVDKFGIMPNMQFPIEDIEKIATYIFDNNIETDDWLAKNYNGTIVEPIFEDDDYLGFGRHIAMSTKKQLGKNLKKTIKNKGTLAAVSYCNVRALPITDSMATKFDVNITRVSDKQRNPNNSANSTEKHYITTYQTQLNNQLELKPILNETESLATFYMPIVTNDMCLQCHGDKNSIDKGVLAEINILYSKDIATGYDVNQIRGLWKVEIKKN